MLGSRKTLVVLSLVGNGASPMNKFNEVVLAGESASKTGCCFSLHFLLVLLKINYTTLISLFNKFDSQALTLLHSLRLI